jgi:hypothetical protein
MYSITFVIMCIAIPSIRGQWRVLNRQSLVGQFHLETFTVFVLFVVVGILVAFFDF